MSDLLKEFARQKKEEILNNMSVEERLKGLSAEERLKGISLDVFVATLSPEMRAALAQRLRDDSCQPNLVVSAPGSCDPKP